MPPAHTSLDEIPGLTTRTDGSGASIPPKLDELEALMLCCDPHRDPTLRSFAKSQRYRGVYMHGRIKILRRNGKKIRQKADPSEVLSIEIPEWRIVDDTTWFAVAEIFENRARERAERRAEGKPVTTTRQPSAKYPLAGIAKCGVCGGSIGCSYAKRKGERVKAYACVRRHKRGSTVCSATTVQPMDECDELLIDYLRRNIATVEVTELVLAAIEKEIERQMPSPELDIEALEVELAKTSAPPGTSTGTPRADPPCSPGPPGRRRACLGPRPRPAS
jgi:hypothetical protein